MTIQGPPEYGPDGPHPGIRDMDREDIDSVLGRNIVGRIAYLRDGRIDVTPLNYAYWRGSIYGRTAAGGKLDHLRDGSKVTFEVDEIRDGRDWRSVMVHGYFQILRPNLGEESWMLALGAIRRIQREALRTDDPFPDRTQVFRIVIEEVRGRAMG